MKRITLSFVVALAFVVLGIGGLALVTSRLPFNSPVTAVGGPGTFPAIYLVIIVAFSAILAVTELVKSFSASQSKSSESKQPAKIEKKDMARILLMIAAVTVYISILNTAGFLIATPLLTLALLWLFGYRNKIISPVLAAGFAFLLYSVFQTFLKIPLP